MSLLLLFSYSTLLFLQFESGNPAMVLSEPLVSETELSVSLSTSSWDTQDYHHHYQQHALPLDGACPSANITISSNLSTQTHTIMVTVLSEKRTRSGQLSLTHCCD